MISLVVFVRFAHALRRGFADPEFRGILALLLILLVTGTLVYRQVESWSVLDAFYFSVITLATVGYGDLTPTKAFTKLFTIVYVFVGIGVVVAFAQWLARDMLVEHAQRREHQSGEQAGAGTTEALGVDRRLEGVEDDSR